MYADGLTVDFVYIIHCKCCDGRVDCWIDVLVPLPAEDWDLQASLSFKINAERADDRTQNWFHTIDIDGLQYQYRLANEVNASSTLINDSILSFLI